MLRHLSILAHRVGDASSRTHAGKRGTDQSQKDRKRLAQHEDAPAAGPEQSITDHDHHVTERRRRALRIHHRIPAIKEVVGGEVFEEVAEGSLNQQ